MVLAKDSLHYPANFVEVGPVKSTFPVRPRFIGLLIGSLSCDPSSIARGTTLIGLPLAGRTLNIGWWVIHPAGESPVMGALSIEAYDRYEAFANAWDSSETDTRLV